MKWMWMAEADGGRLRGSPAIWVLFALALIGVAPLRASAQAPKPNDPLYRLHPRGAGL